MFISLLLNSSELGGELGEEAALLHDVVQDRTQPPSCCSTTLWGAFLIFMVEAVSPEPWVHSSLPESGE